MAAREIRAGTKLLPFRARIGNPADYHMSIEGVRAFVKEHGDGDFYVLFNGRDAIVCFEDARIAMIVKLKFGR